MTVFVSRADWGHTGPRGGHILGAGYARALVIHHTPGQQPASYDDAVAEMRQVLRTHLGNGWADIGYSWVVWGGYAFEGRGFFRSGAHAPGVNSTSVGVAFLLDGRRRLPTADEWQAVRDVMARAVAEGAASPGFRVTGHRDVVATECPGQPLYDRLGDYDTLAPANTPPTPPATPDEEDDLMAVKMRQYVTPASADGSIPAKVWGVFGCFRLHIISDSHRNLLIARDLLDPVQVQCGNVWDLDNLHDVTPGP